MIRLEVLNIPRAATVKKAGIYDCYGKMWEALLWVLLDGSEMRWKL